MGKLFMLFFAVGKTSLITRFMYDSFDNIYQVHKCWLILHSKTVMLYSVAICKHLYVLSMPFVTYFISV